MKFPDDLIQPARALSGLSLGDDFLRKAEKLIEEVLRWNQKIRLVGHREPRTAFIDLILDGLALVPHLPGASVLDIGSGAGFPGLVLALALPNVHITMVEGRAKKVSFQKHAIRILEISSNTEAVLGRAGEGVLPGRMFDNITLRAVSDLDVCQALAKPYLASGGRLVLPRSLNDEPACRESGFDINRYALPNGKDHRIIAVKTLQ